MRAREPDREGYVEHDGVKLHFEVFGEGETTLLLLPAWTVINARFWKAQVHHLARHHRVVTYDGPGNGRSDRPLDAAPYRCERQGAAAVAVLDATGTDRGDLALLHGSGHIPQARDPVRVNLLLDEQELRERLGWSPDERVVVVTVGGSGVGAALLRRVVAAFPAAARRVDGLRMLAVAGPRIDPASLDAPAGVEVVGFVPDLPRHLAACDLAVVQGGLTTCMELTACRRPFLYFPLRGHFEQNVHVAHRLGRYRAGRRMDYAAAAPEAIAAAVAEELDRPVGYRPVETDGAAGAAALIAALL